MKDFRILKWLSKHRVHKWNPVFERGANLYLVCKKCGKRKIMHSPWGYTPIDRAWLNGEEGLDRNDPPGGNND